MMRFAVRGLVVRECAGMGCAERPEEMPPYISVGMAFADVIQLLEQMTADSKNQQERAARRLQRALSTDAQIVCLHRRASKEANRNHAVLQRLLTQVHQLAWSAGGYPLPG